MVKPILRYFKLGNAVLKPHFQIFLLVTVCMIASSCSIKETTKQFDDKSAQVNSKIIGKVVKMFDRKLYDIPSNIQIQDYCGNDEFLILYDSRSIGYAYNVKTNSARELIRSQSNLNEIRTAKANKNWIIWSENEKPEGDLNLYHPYNWSIYAKNRNTGEIISIDKTNFKSKKEALNKEYTINHLSISEDTLVYVKHDPQNLSVGCIIAFDLNEKKMYEVASETGDASLSPASIHNRKVVWSRYHGTIPETEPRKHFMPVMYADLFVKDLDTGNIEQITNNGFYQEAHIYDDIIVATKIPEMVKNQSAASTVIVMFDKKDNYKEKIIVNKFSPSSEEHYIENSNSHSIVNEETPDNLLVNIGINSKYISWSDNAGDTRFLYDYKNSSFIQLFDMKLPYNPAHYIDTRAMFENYILVFMAKENKLYLLDMDTAN